MILALIQAKRESGLTAVWLKQDLPVVYVQFYYLKWSKTSTLTGRNLMMLCDFVNLL